MFGHSPASLAGIVQVVFDLDLAALTPAAGNGDPSQTYSEFSEPTTWLLSIGVGGFILSGDGSMRLGNPNDFGGRDYFETSVVYSPGSNGFADMKLLGKTANDLYSDWHDPSTLEFINMPAELQLSDNQGLSYWVMPGVITIRAIPEPSTWILLSLGFGLIGGALRRRRTYVPA